MVKSSSCTQGTETNVEPLWPHLGRRLQLRRSQLGIVPHAAASHLDVPLALYEQYEAGQALIPAEQLAQLAELFRVPMFYFFQALPVGDDKAVVVELKPSVAYSVATETDRIVALVRDFQKLDFQRQQHLLQLARALAKDAAANGM